MRQELCCALGRRRKESACILSMALSCLARRDWIGRGQMAALFRRAECLNTGPAGWELETTTCSF